LNRLIIIMSEDKRWNVIWIFVWQCIIRDNNVRRFYRFCWLIHSEDCRRDRFLTTKSFLKSLSWDDWKLLTFDWTRVWSTRIDVTKFRQSKDDKIFNEFDSSRSRSCACEDFDSLNWFSWSVCRFFKDISFDFVSFLFCSIAIESINSTKNSTILSFMSVSAKVKKSVKASLCSSCRSDWLIWDSIWFDVASLSVLSMNEILRFLY
jgi:hypothetical protein